MSNSSQQPYRTLSFNQFNRAGFHQLPTQYENTMGSASANDVEQGIPLEQIPSAGNGLRPQNSLSALRPQETQASQTSSAKRRLLFRGRRHKPDPTQQKGNRGWDAEEDTITTMGKIYHRILNFSVVTRYFLYVLPLALIIAIPIIIGAVSETNATLAHVPLVWFFVWVEVVWLSLWGSKIVAHFLPYIFQFLMGVVSSGVRKYSRVISRLEIPLSLVGWSVTSLATFIPIMTRNPTSLYWKDHPGKSPIDKPTEVQQWQYIVQKILGAATVASLLYLGEKVFIQIISINYHHKQFSNRIKDSKRNVWLLGLLYEASRTLFPQYCNEFAEEDYAIADQLNISRGLGGLTSRGLQSHHRTGSATPMRIIQNVGRVGDKITSAFGNVAHEITGREVFNPNSAHSIVIEALERKRTSEALAKRVWMSFVVEGRDSLTQEDIFDVLGAEHKEEAEEAFLVLDRDGNGDVSLDEMILTVTDFSRERKAVANSMHDVDQAINVLDRMLMVLVFIAVVLVFIAFLVADFTTTLATAGTALISLSFIFSTSAQEVLNGCVFLFVKHPYDIGDRVNIGGLPVGVNGNAFVVEHISLLFTVFRHMQGLNCGQICQIPHLSLNLLWIENVSRSKAMSEQFNINISYDTSFDDLQILKNELLNFVTDKENSRDFAPTVDLDVLGTTDQSLLTLMIEIKHKSNWANESIRRARRSKFMCAMVAAMRAVPIYAPGANYDAAGTSANPTYTVAISDEIAKKAAEGTAKGREDARLVPLKKGGESDQPSDSAGNTSSAPFLSLGEERVIGELTARDPASDPARDEVWNSSGTDGSTLGERPSIDRQDLEEVRGMLRRESTRGKRKPPSTEYHRTVETIYEPGSIRPPPQQQQQQPIGSSFGQQSTAYQSPAASAGYQQYGAPLHQTMSYENDRPPVSSAYRPTVRVQSPPYHQQQMEMRQSPYRGRGESISRRPLVPPGGNGEYEEKDDEGPRPYSGVG